MSVPLFDGESMNATFISDDEFRVKDRKTIFVFSKAKPNDTNAKDKKADETTIDDNKEQKDK